MFRFCLPVCLPGVILSHLCCSRLQSVATFAVADADAANKEAEFFLTGWQIEKKKAALLGSFLPT